MAVIVLLLIFFLCVAPAKADLPQPITVNLFEAFPPTKEVRILGRFKVLGYDLPGLTGPATLALKEHTISIVPQGKVSSSGGLSGRFLTITGSNETVTIQYPGKPARRYAGLIEISEASGSLHLRNVVPRRAYVASVVGSETLPDWPVEMLKAQAVLTQTKLVRYRPNDKLGDSTQSEAYLGADYVRPLVRQAVQDVWGRTLRYQGTPIEVFYHSTCAGCTSNAETYFSKPEGSLPYLRGVQCAYCKNSPFWKTKISVIPRAVFERACGQGIPAVGDKDRCQRPLTVRPGNGDTTSGYKFWLQVGQTLGWDKMPGTRYSVSATTGGDIELRSTGAGHGIGLCQWGAAELARQGKRFEEILKFYYPSTQVF